MSVITYKYSAVPKQPETFRRDLEVHRAEITSNLNIFLVPWEREFFGIEGNLTMHIKLSGEILVSGPDEDGCKEKIKKIQEVISQIYAAELPYEDPKLIEVEFRHDAEADISKIVYSGVMEIVKEKISHEYDVKDISFVFAGDKPEKNLQISFERTGYIKGKERVPLQVVIIAPDRQTCEVVWKSLLEKLSMVPRG